MKHKTNIRAINSEELLQIIDNSSGIYESTLVKLLQCNRISLESRLNTLEKNELVSKKKINKKFYYTKKYDINNILNFDLQADATQNLLGRSLYTEHNQIIDDNNEKKLFLELFSSTHQRNESTINKANELLNKTNSSKQDYFQQFFSFYTFKVPIIISSMINTNDFYRTVSLDNIELLAIKSEEQILKVTEKLKDLTYVSNFEKNNFIREDILLYVQELNSTYYFSKSNGKYTLNEIKDIIDFIYYLSNYSVSEKTVYFSNNKKKFKEMYHLYLKSSENKKKFDTRKKSI